MASALRTAVPRAVSIPSYVLLLELLFPGPPTLGSLVALGWRGILWMGPSRLPRSATMGTLPMVGPPLFLPRVSDVGRDMDMESWGPLDSLCPAHMDFSIWKTARGATFRFSKSTRILGKEMRCTVNPESHRADLFLSGGSWETALQTRTDTRARGVLKQMNL